MIRCSESLGEVKESQDRNRDWNTGLLGERGIRVLLKWNVIP